MSNSRPCLHRVLLQAYVDGEVYNENDRAIIDAHVGACDSCVEALDQLVSQDEKHSTASLPNRETVSRDMDDTDPDFIERLPRSLLESDTWRWLGLIGGGGGGDVYLARHHRSERLYAVKVVRLPVSPDSERSRRADRDKLVASIPRHRNLPRIELPEVIAGHAIIPIQYVFGEDLEQYAVRRGGRLPVEEACGLMYQAAVGLGHAHANHLVHRDIKPANLALGQDGIVKILDFGLAKLLDVDAMSQGTPTSLPESEPLDTFRLNRRAASRMAMPYQTSTVWAARCTANCQARALRQRKWGMRPLKRSLPPII
ncbi:MAG: protein kinase [Pirellulaceae bacterium]